MSQKVKKDNADRHGNTMGKRQKESRKTKSHRSSIEEDENKEDEGNDYPLDIWFIISEYILPETVGKFARICKSSYHVTKTGKFWFHLYKKYCQPVSNMPERLQPQYMIRVQGLRACVIRALHSTYFASKKEKDDVSYLRQDDPHSLVRRQCCLMWHKYTPKFQMENTRWYFFFKLKEMSRPRNSFVINKHRNNTHKKTEFLKMLEDVAINPEEGCKILRVACLKYTKLEPVIGLILQTVSINLMPGFKNHRLQLGFGTSDVPNAITNRVILTDVIDYQILDWWHPCYPHMNIDPMIDLSESCSLDSGDPDVESCLDNVWD